MKRSLCRSRLRLFAGVLASVCVCGLLVPARADYASDAKVLNSVRAVLNAKQEGAPAERLARAQQMIAAAQVSPRIEVMMVRDIANFQRRQLKDNALAIQTTEAGIAKYTDVPERSRLIGYKIELLGLNDPDEAVAYGKAQWPAIQKGDAAMWADVAMPYLTVLRAVGDDATRIELLRGVWTGNLSNAGNAAGDWMAPEMARVLIEQGKNAEALSYAKLAWMLAEFKTQSINDATKALLEVWARSDEGGQKSEAFVAAQTDAEAPNPLRDIPLPALSSAQLARTPSGSEERVTLLLAAGEFRRAMLEARGMMLNRPDAPEGVEQVARVFKAADGKLVRANAFVAWVKAPEGPNPILAFLREYAPDAAT